MSEFTIDVTKLSESLVIMCMLHGATTAAEAVKMVLKDLDDNCPEIYSFIFDHAPLFIGHYMSKLLTSSDGRSLIPINVLSPAFDITDPDMLGYHNRRLVCRMCLNCAIRSSFSTVRRRRIAAA